MHVSKIIFTLMGLVYAIGSHAYATLEFVDGSEDLEEGRTYRVSFVYVQTEGIDDFGDLAYNPTFFTNAVIPVGCGFSCDFRSGEASVSVWRESDDVIGFQTPKGTKYLPLPGGEHSFAVGMRDADLLLWIDADTASAPVASFTGFARIEGDATYNISEGVVANGTRMHYDYAYGLRFKFSVPEGTTVRDVEKTNDQRVLFNYKHSTLPPLLYRSSLSNDGKYVYCDLEPTPMSRPIPYGTVYSFTWIERVEKCDPVLTNRVVVELYGHEADEVSFEKPCPCGENTCDLKSVSISTDTYCTGRPALLSANTEILGTDCYCEWKMNGAGLAKEDGTNQLAVERDGFYKVTVADRNDPTCVVESEEFELKRSAEPHVRLPERVSTLSSASLMPAVSNDAGFKYLWSTGEETKSIRVSQPGRYNLTVSNGLCKTEVGTLVEFSFCDDCIPAVVTPNGDGINDYFEVEFLRDKYPDAEVTVYDRNGNVLDKFAGSERWNGTYMGNPVPSTDYWYKIDIEAIDQTFYGHFSLLRSGD